MRVEWALACRDIGETDDGHQALVGPGLDTTILDKVGDAVRLDVAVCLVGRYDESLTPSARPLHLEVTGPSLQIVHEVVWQLPVEMATPQMFHPGWEGRSVQPVPVVFLAPEPGPYLLRFDFDGTEAVTLALMVEIIGS